MTIYEEIERERIHQIADEGFDAEHDDQYQRLQLARGAACYAIGTKDGIVSTALGDIPIWPWEESWFKPSDPRRNLIKAAALIVAEIERLDRETA